MGVGEQEASGNFSQEVPMMWRPFLPNLPESPFVTCCSLSIKHDTSKTKACDRLMFNLGDWDSPRLPGRGANWHCGEEGKVGRLQDCSAGAA